MNGGDAPLTLVLGGVRSGKSEVGERLATEAAGGAAVTYVATARLASADPDFAARIDRHRRRRPTHWFTVEAGDDLSAAVAGASGVVLVDSLTTWVSGLENFDADPAPLLSAVGTHPHPVIVVSDEVGLGGYPATEVGGASPMRWDVATRRWRPGPIGWCWW